jgi:hypothetical protein
MAVKPLKCIKWKFLYKNRKKMNFQTMNCKAVHYEVRLLTSAAHLFKLLQQFLPFQHSAANVVPGCKQLK